MNSPVTELQVDLGDRSYPIVIGPGLISRYQGLRDVVGSQAMIVTNSTIEPLYLAQLKSALDVPQLDQVVLADGEQHKHLASIELIYDALLNARHNRSTTLIALGGGVIGDMTGFAAATYMRGVRFVQVPTTLLAQVDSSVGGKTGVNHPLGKNMIGAFHQPELVLIDTDTLSSLPVREFSAGIAEVIKYGLICDAPFFEWLEANMSRLMARDNDALRYAIARSCENKARVVAADEREAGVRAILNLGHTFGHAIETAGEYGKYLHGEAVAVGMLMAVDLGVRMGELESQVLDRCRALNLAAGLPDVPPTGLPDVEAMLALMGLDKKVIDGRLRLILLNAIGEAAVRDDFDMALLRQTLSQWLALASPQQG